MSEDFILKHADYIEEVKKKLYWEVQVTDNKVYIVQRGGPLEPTVLTISGTNLVVEDWWGWGAG